MVNVCWCTSFEEASKLSYAIAGWQITVPAFKHVNLSPTALIITCITGMTWHQQSMIDGNSVSL